MLGSKRVEMCVQNGDRKPDAERRAHARDAGTGVFVSVAVFTLRPGHPARPPRPRVSPPSAAGSPCRTSPTHFSFLPSCPLARTSAAFTLPLVGKNRRRIVETRHRNRLVRFIRENDSKSYRLLRHRNARSRPTAFHPVPRSSANLSSRSAEEQ